MTFLGAHSMKWLQKDRQTDLVANRVASSRLKQMVFSNLSEQRESEQKVSKPLPISWMMQPFIVDEGGLEEVAHFHHFGHFA